MSLPPARLIHRVLSVDMPPNWPAPGVPVKICPTRPVAFVGMIFTVVLSNIFKCPPTITKGAEIEEELYMLKSTFGPPANQNMSPIKMLSLELYEAVPYMLTVDLGPPM